MPLVKFWQTESEWHALRRERLGGSEVAALGTDDPVATFMKRASGAPVKDTMPIVLGRRLESGVLRAASDLWGVEFLSDYQGAMFVDDDNPRMGYTPDGVSSDGLVEVKCGRMQDWGRGGTEVIPYPYYLQVQWGMEITKHDNTLVLHLHGAKSGGGLILSRHPIARNAPLGGLLRSIAPLLWEAKEQGDETKAKEAVAMLGVDLF